MATTDEVENLLRTAKQRAAELSAEADRLLVEAVQEARDIGWSYNQIAELLGVTRQAAWERFAKRVKKR